MNVTWDKKSWVVYIGNTIVEKLDAAPEAWMLWSNNTWKLCGNIYAVEAADPVVYLVPRRNAGLQGPVYREEHTLDYLIANGKLEAAMAELKMRETLCH